MEKIDGKGIISLVKNDFTPLEESKEGYLKGGFGSVIQVTTSSVTGTNNCMCNGGMDNCLCNDGLNNCKCPDTCWVPNTECRPSKKGNNCNCGTTLPPTTSGTGPTPISLTQMLPGFGF